MNLKFEFGWIWSGGMNLNDMNLNLVEFDFTKQLDRSIWQINFNDMNLVFEFEWYEFGWIWSGNL